MKYTYAVTTSERHGAHMNVVCCPVMVVAVIYCTTTALASFTMCVVTRDETVRPYFALAGTGRGSDRAGSAAGPAVSEERAARSWAPIATEMPGHSVVFPASYDVLGGRNAPLNTYNTATVDVSG